MNSVLRCAAALATALVLLLGVLPAARADDSGPPVRGQVNILVLGDSYAAGAGAGDYEPSEGIYFRSRNNWAQQYAQWLIDQRVSATVTNRARPGAATTQVVDEQIAEIREQNQQGIKAVDPSQIDLVALSVGGSDGPLSEVVRDCFFIGYQDAGRCRDAIANFQQIIDRDEDGLRARVLSTLAAVDELVTNPKAEIVLMGYPHLATPNSDDYVLSECVRSSAGGCSESRDFYPAQEVRALNNNIGAALAEAVQTWNTQSGRKAHYVDSVAADFEGHEPSPSFITKNPARWINEFFETEGAVDPQGATVAETSQDQQTWYHPNITGHEEMAGALMQKLGIPTAMRPLDAETPAFAWLQGPYAGPVGQPLELSAAASYAAGKTPVKFEWDFDGDGLFDQETTTPTVTHTWHQEHVGDVRVRVSGAGGETAEATTYAMITGDGDITPAEQDNCPGVYNYSQSDRDGDGLGDACDPRPGSPS
ncbi:MAG: GDSL-type esterase/lipase family protein [Propionibacteriaceae bacterium]|nr:GDSL-type esterase/lipase family protein [Propionibacteriaceae bacterium]